MLKQQTVSTSLGPLTVSSLTLGDLRRLDHLFADMKPGDQPSIASLLKYMPIIFGSARRFHQDMTQEQMEDGLTMEDFTALFDAVLSVSGLKKTVQPAGEAQQPEAVPV